MKQVFFIIIILSVQQGAIAQKASKDFESLVFKNDLEQASFKSDLITERERLMLFLSVNSNINDEKIKGYERQLSDFYNILRKKNIHKNLKSQKVKRAVKIIHKNAHQHFFKKYQELAELHETFENGTYNCLTATIILALTLDEFNIPYEVRELPTHVYIVVEANGKQLILESTDPKNGIYKVDKESWAKDMKRLQIISSQEFREKSTDELFNQYGTVPPAKISYKELAADLYFNASIVLHEQGKYNEAYEMIDKGMYLYPKRAASFDRIAIIYQLTLAIDIKKPSSLEPLFILLDFPEYQGIAAQDIINNLRFAGQKFLIENDDTASYWAVKNFIDQRLDNDYKGLKIALEASHQLCFGYAFTLKGNDEKGLFHLEKALDRQPNNLRIQSIITEVILGKIRKMPLENIYDSLLVAQENYAFITQFETYQQFFAIGLATKTEHYFYEHDTSNGFIMLEKFYENIIKKPLNHPVYQEAVSITYDSVQRFYIAQSDFKNALIWVEKGLELVPLDENLLRKRALLESY